MTAYRNTIVRSAEAMKEKHGEPENDPYRFILDHLDSVPHLEALILLWNSRPVAWTLDELGSRLYISLRDVAAVLRDLEGLDLVRVSGTNPPKYSYAAKSEAQNELMRGVDNAYRRDLVRISTMIHQKPSSSVRDFARAFLIKKGNRGPRND